MALITNKRSFSLFLCLNAPFWVLYFVSGQLLRVSIVVLSFVAMWSLWVARRERRHLWTTKMTDIWLVQYLWCIAAAEGNIELYYRHARPSVAILLVAGILCLTVKSVFDGDLYLIDQKD